MAVSTTDSRKPLFPTFVWGFLLFCFFGLLAVVAVRYYGSFQNYEDQRALERLANMKEYRETMEGKLQTLAWADKETKTVQVPIAVAMEIATRNLNKKEVSPSAVPVILPAPPAEPAEAGAASTETAAPEAAAPEAATPETTTQE